MNWSESTADRIAAIKANHPLSSIIGAHVELKRCGRELRGCCPFHQDRTPSFYVNDEKGQYHCFGCGAGGDAINFIKEYNNMSFNEALDFFDHPHAQIPHSTTWAPTERTDRIDHARKIWEQCGPVSGTPAELYLESRALPIELIEKQSNLRFGRIPFKGSGALPAIVAAVRNVEGDLTGIQRIYLTEEGEKLCADCKRSLGTLRGGAVRIVGEDGPSPANHLTITEGIEDALSVARIQGQATVWATLGTSNLAKVNLPVEVTEVDIAHDNDEAGCFAALEAKIELVHHGIKVRMQAPTEFKDWNDHLVYWDRGTALRYYNQLPWKMGESDMLESIGFDEYDNYDDLWEKASSND